LLFLFLPLSLLILPSVGCACWPPERIIHIDSAIRVLLLCATIMLPGIIISTLIKSGVYYCMGFKDKKEQNVIVSFSFATNFILYGLFVLGLVLNNESLYMIAAAAVVIIVEALLLSKVFRSVQKDNMFVASFFNNFIAIILSMIIYNVLSYEVLKDLEIITYNHFSSF
jgi:hypothetical protein